MGGCAWPVTDVGLRASVGDSERRVGRGDEAAGALGVRVRPASRADLDAIASIEQVCFSRPWSRAAFAAALGDPVSRLLVAEGAVQGERSEVLGYAVLYVVADQAELANLAVAPAFRGRGVGRALLESVVAVARELGVRQLFLEVRQSNSVAQRLYRSVGFVPVALRRGYYEAPVEDALVMALRLDDVVRTDGG